MFQRRVRARCKNVAKLARVTALSPLKTCPMRRMGKRSRSDLSFGPSSIVLDYPMYPLLTIHRPAWRLVFLRRRGGRAMWHGSDWDTVGGATERSRNPAPTVKEIVQESAQQATDTGEPPASTKEGRPEPSTTTGAGGLVVAEAEEEAPAEARVVDIASILGAPSVTVVRSNL
jgi:hypothetical protein